MHNPIFSENSSDASSTSSSSSSFHSSITNTQFPSHNSASSSSSGSSSCSSNRCPGLDLLVKAIQQVSSGSAVGIPYAQRRVLIRRRRRKGVLNFSTSTLDQLLLCGDQKKGIDEHESIAAPMRQRRRSVALPSKYNDSILPTWKPRSVGGWAI